MDMQTTIKTNASDGRRSFTEDQRLELGRIAHERNEPISRMAVDLGLADSQLRDYMRRYSDVNGLPTDVNHPQRR